MNCRCERVCMYAVCVCVCVRARTCVCVCVCVCVCDLLEVDLGKVALEHNGACDVVALSVLCVRERG